MKEGRIVEAIQVEEGKTVEGREEGRDKGRKE